MMNIFAEFGAIRNEDPASVKAQNLAKKLQNFITEHLYTCSKEILAGLGRMYAGGGDLIASIDKAGGAGTAELAHRSIEIYCKDA